MTGTKDMAGTGMAPEHCVGLSAITRQPLEREKNQKKKKKKKKKKKGKEITFIPSGHRNPE